MGERDVLELLHRAVDEVVLYNNEAVVRQYNQSFSLKVPVINSECRFVCGGKGGGR